MKFNEFKEEIEQIYAKWFPVSSCKCKIFHCFGKSITIDCTLGKDSQEYINGISENDAIKASFMIVLPDGFNENDDLPGSLEMKALKRVLQVKPEDPVYYCSYNSIPFRKMSGPPRKLISAFERFTEKLFKTVMKEYRTSNLLPYPTELIRNKNYVGGLEK